MEPNNVLRSEPPVAATNKRIHPLMKGWAVLISYLLHPVFMTTYMSVALYFLLPAQFAGIGKEGAKQWLPRIILMTVLFPLLSIVLLRALGFIKTIHMREPKERIIPLIMIMIFHFWMYQVARNVPDTPLLLRSLILGAYLSVIIMFLVSIFYKVSMHTTAAGGMIGLLAVMGLTSSNNMATPFFIVLGLAGLIGTARLVLKEHTQAQVYLGYGLGIISQLVAWLYLR